MHQSVRLNQSVLPFPCGLPKGASCFVFQQISRSSGSGGANAEDELARISGG